MHFLDPKNDYAFKQLFGNKKKKNVLINFLNHILDKKEEDLITEVTLLDPRQAPHLKGTKETILDVYCHDQSGAEYIVEMQVLFQDYFDKRVLYYASKAYFEQLDTGDDYPKLKPVIFLGILNFRFTEDQDYISTHRITNVKTANNAIEDFQFTFIELPKFNKSEHELKTITEQWVYFVKNAYKLKAVPEEIHEEAIKEAFKIVERALWTREQLALYDASDKRRRDREMETHASLRKGIEEGMQKGIAEGMKKGIEVGRQEGRQEGLQEGRQEGLQEACNKNALKMLAKGADENFICEVTGLTQKELDQLKQSSEAHKS